METIERIEHLPVETPEGLVSLEIHRRVVDPGEKLSLRVTLRLKLQGEDVLLEGTTTEQTLLKLAKRLPEGWRIRSCLSCRHGHFCPYGDADNELFCVPDFDPKDKFDLLHVTVDHDECARRSRTLFDLCEAYAPQTMDYFTYSDYRYVMERENRL